MPLTVSFVTPDKHVTEAEVDMVTAPSAMGQVGILPNHRSLLAELVPGVVELKQGAYVEEFAISGGFLEVDRNHVALLVETAERPGEIDVERARAALADSEAALKKLSPADSAYQDNLARVVRARVRLSVAGRS